MESRTNNKQIDLSDERHDILEEHQHELSHENDCCNVNSNDDNGDEKSNTVEVNNQDCPLRSSISDNDNDDDDNTDNKKNENCCVCGADALYTCPGCHRRTCSLTCVRVHKADYQCTGTREIAAPIALHEYNDAQLERDYTFLEDCRRVIDNATRLLPRTEFHFNFRHLPAPLSALRQAAKRRGVICQLVSSGMQRREVNTSRYDKATDTIIWHCDFHFNNSSDNFTIATEWGSERFKLEHLLRMCWATNPPLPSFHINRKYNRSVEYTKQVIKPKEGNALLSESTSVQSNKDEFEGVQEHNVQLASSLTELPIQNVITENNAINKTVEENSKSNENEEQEQEQHSDDNNDDESDSAESNSSSTSKKSNNNSKQKTESVHECIETQDNSTTNNNNTITENDESCNTVCDDKHHGNRDHTIFGHIHNNIDTNCITRRTDAKDSNVTELFDSIKALTDDEEANAERVRAFIGDSQIRSPEENLNSFLLCDRDIIILCKAEHLTGNPRYFHMMPHETLNENMRLIFFVNEYPVFEVIYAQDLHKYELMTAEDKLALRQSLCPKPRVELTKVEHTTRDLTHLSEEEKIKLGKIPCKHFLRGKCSSESNCPYWHCTRDELPVCRQYARNKRCPLGKRCLFKHEATPNKNDKELRNVSNSYKPLKRPRTHSQYTNTPNLQTSHTQHRVEQEEQLLKNTQLI